MFNLILFEIRKTYLKRYIIILFFLLVIINIAVIYTDYYMGDEDYFLAHNSTTKEQRKFYKELHKDVDGELTDNKINFVVQEYNRLNKIISQGNYSTEFQPDTYTGYIVSDYVMIKLYFYDYMKYIKMYELDSNSIVKKAKENITFYQSYGNRYEKNRNEMIVKLYSDRKLDCFYDTRIWEKLFDYNFTDLIIICIIIMGVVPIYINERTTKMDSLILTSRNGKVNMTFAKVLSNLIVIAMLCIFLAGTNIIIFKLLYGLKFSNIPLYSIRTYKYTSLNCTLGEFYLLLIIFKVIAFFSFSMIISMISSLFHKMIYPFMLSVLILIFGLYTSGYIVSIERYKMWLSMISPFSLIKGKFLYSILLGCNIFDMFVLRSNICVAIQFCNIVVSFVVLTFSGTRNSIRMTEKGEQLNV